MIQESNNYGQLKRAIDWKQGLANALGAPILILPSIGYFASLLGPAAILIWVFSVIQGLMQNIAYGELAVMFPKSSGLPGYIQAIFGRNGQHDAKRHGVFRFIGGIGAWGYMFGWSFVMPIFALQIGIYLHNLIPGFSEISENNLSLFAGALIFSSLFLINYRGVHNGAIFAYLLAVFTLIPLAVIIVSPFITGGVDMNRVVEHWLPLDWSWDALHIMFIFGILGMAQWSACASETAAIYGPEYKKPKTDLPKALFICSAICVVTYFCTQLSATAALGIDGILKERLSPLLPLAQVSFGPIGVYTTILMLVAAMILLIQTAYLAASRAIHSMSTEGNLPRVFGKTNHHGTPVVAMAIIGLLGMLLILVGSPEAIVAASAFGYMISHGMTLFAYFKAKRNPEMAKIPRPFKAPRGWQYIALIYGLLTLPLYFIGLIFLNGYNLGWTPTIIGLATLLLYIPLWFYTQHREAILDLLKIK